MTSILSSLKVETLPKSGQWRLTESLFWYHPVTGRNVVPKGFPTDLASIPRFFRRVFNVNGRHREEAVVHDYLYSKKGELGELKLTRKQCDQIFHDLMKADGIAAWKRKSMYQAVRYFGGSHWDD